MRTFLAIMAALTLAACGGNVVIDGAPGTGGGGTVGTGGAVGTGGTSNTTTSTSSSSSSTSSGTVVTCPDPFPGTEAACSQEGQVCAVPLTCCGGNATCTNGFWKYHAYSCGLPCSSQGCGPDGFACAAGAVCVALIGATTAYQCQDDPCAGAPLACSCAAELCTSWMLTCNNIQQGFKVLCD
jgi:hypothetical protein